MIGVKKFLDKGSLLCVGLNSHGLQPQQLLADWGPPPLLQHLASNTTLKESLDSAPKEAVVTAGITRGPWMLSAYSVVHSLIRSFSKCLLNVCYGTIQNTGGKWWAKLHNLCFHRVYSLWKKYMNECYPCDKFCEGEELGLKGEVREKLKEEWRAISRMDLGELLRQRKYYTPSPPTLEIWKQLVPGVLRVRGSKGEMWLGREGGAFVLGSGFQTFNLSARKRQKGLGQAGSCVQFAFWSLLLLPIGEGLQGDPRSGAEAPDRLLSWSRREGVIALDWSSGHVCWEVEILRDIEEARSQRRSV